jgi:hypothetical protein
MQYTVSYTTKDSKIKTVDVNNCEGSMDAKLVVSQLPDFKHILKVVKFQGEDDVQSSVSGK